MHWILESCFWCSYFSSSTCFFFFPFSFSSSSCLLFRYLYYHGCLGETANHKTHSLIPLKRTRHSPSPGTPFSQPNENPIPVSLKRKTSKSTGLHAPFHAKAALPGFLPSNLNVNHSHVIITIDYLSISHRGRTTLALGAEAAAAPAPAPRGVAGRPCEAKWLLVFLSCACL